MASFFAWLVADLILVVITAFATWQFASLHYEEQERRVWWAERGGWPDYDPAKDRHLTGKQRGASS